MTIRSGRGNDAAPSLPCRHRETCRRAYRIMIFDLPFTLGHDFRRLRLFKFLPVRLEFHQLNDREIAVEKLFTIGYEGVELKDFITALKAAGATVLLDVRELPISRRRGFSKNALKAALAEAGIDYRHERQLGSPRDVRHRLREDWDYQRFFRDFNKHLDKQSALLDRLAEELTGGVALMCYERDHTTCHRDSVVNQLANKLDLKPVHLNV
jgi:uncharacterized protein (DUF488 family)